MEPFRAKHFLPYIDVFLLGESTQNVEADPENKCILGIDPARTLMLLQNATIVYIHPNNFDEWTDILIALAAKDFPIKLFIFSGSDYTFHTGHIEAVAAFYPNAQFWIQNWIDDHPAVLPLPIGVNLFTEVSIERQHIFCISFVTINSIERIAFQEFILEHPEFHRFIAPYLEGEEFCRLLKSHYFSFCPQGNGFDSYRVWESLACGAIPIMKETPFTLTLYKHYPYLPIIYIKDYSDLFQIIPALSKEMYDSIMSESDCSVMTREYWITKIEALRNSL